MATPTRVTRIRMTTRVSMPIPQTIHRTIILMRILNIPMTPAPEGNSRVPLDNATRTMDDNRRAETTLQILVNGLPEATTEDVLTGTIHRTRTPILQRSSRVTPALCEPFPGRHELIPIAPEHFLRSRMAL